MSSQWIYLIVLIAGCHTVSSLTVDLGQNCGRNFSLSHEEALWLVFAATDSDQGEVTCGVGLQVPEYGNRKYSFLVSLGGMAIQESVNCMEERVELEEWDHAGTSLGVTAKLCGIFNANEVKYLLTSPETAKISLTYINHRTHPNETSTFMVMSTPVTEGRCLEDQKQCRNGYCIPGGVWCDLLNNCGDHSDEDKEWAECPYFGLGDAIADWLIGLLAALGCLIAGILLCVLLVFCGCVSCTACGIFGCCMCAQSGSSKNNTSQPSGQMVTVTTTNPPQYPGEKSPYY